MEDSIGNSEWESMSCPFLLFCMGKVSFEHGCVICLGMVTQTCKWASWLAADEIGAAMAVCLFYCPLFFVLSADMHAMHARSRWGQKGLLCGEFETRHNGPKAQNEKKHSSPDKIGHLQLPLFTYC